MIDPCLVCKFMKEGGKCEFDDITTTLIPVDGFCRFFSKKTDVDKTTEKQSRGGGA